MLNRNILLHSTSSRGQVDAKDRENSVNVDLAESPVAGGAGESFLGVVLVEPRVASDVVVQAPFERPRVCVGAERAVEDDFRLGGSYDAAWLDNGENALADRGVVSNTWPSSGPFGIVAR